jgi:hypothetical protein
MKQPLLRHRVLVIAALTAALQVWSGYVQVALAQKGQNAGAASQNQPSGAASPAASSGQQNSAGNSNLQGESFNFSRPHLRQQWRTMPPNLEPAARYVCYQIFEDKDPAAFETNPLDPEDSTVTGSLYGDAPLFAVPKNGTLLDDKKKPILDGNGQSIQCLDRKVAYKEPLKMGDRLVVILQIRNDVVKKLSRVTINVQSQLVGPIIINPVRGEIDAGTAPTGEEPGPDDSGARPGLLGRQLKQVAYALGLEPKPTIPPPDPFDKVQTEARSKMEAIAKSIKDDDQNADKEEIDSILKGVNDLNNPTPSQEAINKDYQDLVEKTVTLEKEIKKEVEYDNQKVEHDKKNKDDQALESDNPSLELDKKRLDTLQNGPLALAEELNTQAENYYYLELQDRLSGDSLPTLSVMAEYEQKDLAVVDTNKQLQCINTLQVNTLPTTQQPQAPQTQAATPPQQSVATQMAPGPCLPVVSSALGTLRMDETHVANLSTNVLDAGWKTGMLIAASTGNIPPQTTISTIGDDGRSLDLSTPVAEASPAALPAPAAPAPAPSPGTPIAATLSVAAPPAAGDTTQNSRLIENLASDIRQAGWGVGMTIASSNSEIPINTKISSIAPDGRSLIMSERATTTHFGSNLTVGGGSETLFTQNGLVPLTSPSKSNFTLVQDILPQVHALSTFNVDAGLVYSSVSTKSFGYSVLKKKMATVAITTGQTETVDPVLFLMWYPKAIDAESPTDCWRTLFPFQDGGFEWTKDYPVQCVSEIAVAAGISMESPTSNFYFGPALEPFRGVQLIGGLTVSKTPELARSNTTSGCMTTMTGTPTMTTTNIGTCSGTPAMTQQFKTGWFIGLSFDLKSYIQSITGFGGGSSTASGNKASASQSAGSGS